MLRGGKPTQRRHLASIALPLRPHNSEALLLGPVGLARLGKAPLPAKGSPSRSQAVSHKENVAQKLCFVGGFVTSIPPRPSYPLPELKLFLAALLQYVSPAGS